MKLYSDSSNNLCIQKPIVNRNWPYGISPYFGFETNVFDRPIFFPFQNPGELPAMNKVVLIEAGSEQQWIINLDGLKGDFAITLQDEGGETFVVFGIKTVHGIHDSKEILGSKKEFGISVFKIQEDLFSNVIPKFKYDESEKTFYESETKTNWDFSGKCSDGELIGKKLIPIKSYPMFSYAAYSFFPNATLIAPN